MPANACMYLAVGRYCHPRAQLYAESYAQAQDELIKQKAQAAELAQKLAEDVATTEELQKELKVLEDEFDVVKQDRAGQQAAVQSSAFKLHMICQHTKHLS